VHAETPKWVYVLSNIVLDIDVDQLATWDEMMNGGGRIEQAWNTLQGEVMPLAPAWLAPQFPQLWKTVDAAKADAAGAFKECRFTNIDSIRNPTLFKLQYRPTYAAGRGARQRAWSWCLSVHAEADVTRKSLEVLLGVEVEVRGPGVPAEASEPRQRRTSKSSVQSTQPSVLPASNAAQSTENDEIVVTEPGATAEHSVLTIRYGVLRAATQNPAQRAQIEA
jgi:hypothetical protein